MVSLDSTTFSARRMWPSGASLIMSVETSQERMGCWSRNARASNSSMKQVCSCFLLNFAEEAKWASVWG